MTNQKLHSFYKYNFKRLLLSLRTKDDDSPLRQIPSPASTRGRITSKEVLNTDVIPKVSFFFNTVPTETPMRET